MTVLARTTTNHEVRRAEDTTIRYSVSGPIGGRTLTLIHGWACARSDFQALTEFLPGNYRVIAVDLAEHGESRSGRGTWTMQEFARDVAAVLEAESVDKTVVVGHSMGGAVALEVAGLIPDKVSRVAVLDALHYLFLFPAMGEQQVEALMQPFRDDYASALRVMVEAGSPPNTDRGLVDRHYNRMLSVRQPAGLHSLEGLAAWDMDAALTAVDQPITLFAVGELLAQAAIDRYGDRIEIVPVNLGSHHFHVESPKGTAELLAGLSTE